VLKHGETFAVLDRRGDIRPGDPGEEGVYHEGTRHLSEFQVTLHGERPLLLSSAILRDNVLLSVDLTNADMFRGGDLVARRSGLHLHRSVLLWRGTCYTRLAIENYEDREVDGELGFGFDADFADIFEVRGVSRARRGQTKVEVRGDARVRFTYEGLDRVTRTTQLWFSPPPEDLSAHAATFGLRLKARERRTFELTVSCSSATRAIEPGVFDVAIADAERERLVSEEAFGQLESSDGEFDGWLEQSRADLCMMTTRTPQGPLPYAGVPWFNAPFGRDAIVTALQTLWVNPALAAGVLRFLAATQATTVDEAKDAQPGKILHESRRGEMANLHEIPFDRYYGSVDATPLFVVLAAAYLRTTGDLALVREVWPHIEAAVEWLDRYGDLDGDGFVEYERLSSEGLVHQGWKDSGDCIFHADGTPAKGPIALAEVQAYAFGAWEGAAEIAAALGWTNYAERMRVHAADLRDNFDRGFWSPECSTYALALDGEKRRCEVRSSNAGQCLFTGIVREHRSGAVVGNLFSHEGFSGWGVRTIATSEARYNPMSYHNGSVWPHDNALIAAGLSRYGYRAHALRVLEALFDASLFMDLNRLPELFCGFPRRPRQGPTLYPVACSPQSWASGATFLLLQSVLGLSVDAPGRRLVLRQPVLPARLQWLELRGIRVGDATLDLELVRHEDDVTVRLLKREGRAEIVVVK
jgi:glycogen debranching enzyme